MAMLPKSPDRMEKEMTEEKKQELRQLLDEAMVSLEIQRSGTEPSLPSMDVRRSPMDVHRYRTYLQQRWTSYSEDSLSVLRSFKPDIVSGTTKSKLLDFIREEFAPFIHEDRLQSASSFITGNLMFFINGFHLAALLEQLLKIAIVHGAEGAVSAFDRCTEDMHAPFQAMALLEGIRLETEIQVFEGIRLVPLPNSTWELPPYLSSVSRSRSEDSFLGKTVLIIDGSVSPIFHKPFPGLFQEGFREDALPFRVDVGGEKFPNFKMYNFYEKFCQALSLACNSPVQIALMWKFLAEDELFNLSSSKRVSVEISDSFGGATEAGKAQIDDAKHLYHILVNLDSNVREKLRIPINRWIKSKTYRDRADKIIDLGIAFESLYLSDIEPPRTELSFRLRFHASWYLGKDKEDRKALMNEFQKIYNWRSSIVHTGKLPKKKKKIPFTPKEVEKFIERSQDLCQQSIMKVLEDGQFPDWKSLILGGEAENDVVAIGENPGGLG